MNAKFYHYINSLAYCILLLSFHSCSNDPDQENFVNVVDQYELNISQMLSEEGGIAALTITSIEDQNCTNSYISHTAVISDDLTRIYLNDILTEGACIPGNTAVTEDILINTKNTALPLEINVKSIIHNEGILHSDNVEFELDLQKFDGLKISRTHIFRIQPKMVWGSFTLSNDELENQINQYINSIDLNYSKLKVDYGFFYIAQDNSITIYKDENESAFLISTDEELDKIKTKIQEFKQLDPSLVFQATNYDGSALNIQ